MKNQIKSQKQMKNVQNTPKIGSYEAKNEKLKVLYVRCSSQEQKTDRQRVSEDQFTWVIEDKISGTVEFFERPGGLELKKLVDKDMVHSISFWALDRAGRSLINILSTVKYFNERGIQVEFISQGIKTLDEEGKESLVGKIFVSLLGSIAEVNRIQLKEAQMQGIALAKARGIYKGRAQNTEESVVCFLQKSKNVKALELLKKGYKGAEVAKILGMSQTTIVKVKKLGLS